VPETTSPPQPWLHYIHCANSPGYLAPNCYVGRLIQNLVMSIEELHAMAEWPEEPSLQQCPTCPALSLLGPAAELIASLNRLLDDFPAADCPDTSSFNLSNIHSSLPAKIIQSYKNTKRPGG